MQLVSLCTYIVKKSVHNETVKEINEFLELLIHLIIYLAIPGVQGFG